MAEPWPVDTISSADDSELAPPHRRLYIQCRLALCAAVSVGIQEALAPREVVYGRPARALGNDDHHHASCARCISIHTKSKEHRRAASLLFHIYLTLALEVLCSTRICPQSGLQAASRLRPRPSDRPRSRLDSAASDA
jgi:hypothetical protein